MNGQHRWKNSERWQAVHTDSTTGLSVHPPFGLYHTHIKDLNESKIKAPAAKKQSGLLAYHYIPADKTAPLTDAQSEKRGGGVLPNELQAVRR